MAASSAGIRHRLSGGTAQRSGEENGVPRSSAGGGLRHLHRYRHHRLKQRALRGVAAGGISGGYNAASAASRGVSSKASRNINAHRGGIDASGGGCILAVAGLPKSGPQSISVL